MLEAIAFVECSGKYIASSVRMILSFANVLSLSIS